MKHSILFWQTKTDYLKKITSFRSGQISLIFINYFIWIFLFFISYLLVNHNSNYFWRILGASIISEIIERYLKSKVYWVRPMFIRHDTTPVGLVDKWYKTGSFPSGHTIKAVFFLLFVVTSHVFSPTLFLVIIFPLLLFRVIIGFHYPIDLIGGVFIGTFVYWLNAWYTFPESLNHIISVIFKTVFFIK